MIDIVIFSLTSIAVIAALGCVDLTKHPHHDDPEWWAIK